MARKEKGRGHGGGRDCGRGRGHGCSAIRHSFSPQPTHESVEKVQCVHQSEHREDGQHSEQHTVHQILEREELR